MFELIGTHIDISQDYIGGDFSEHETEEVVATFDRAEDGEEYIRRSRLQQRIRGGSFSPDIVYRRDSLLHYYSYAEIRQRSEVPHNPEI